MSTFDSPDYQNVVILSSGPVSDAPDWQEVIVGPGGAPAAPGAGVNGYMGSLAVNGVIGATVDPNTVSTSAALASAHIYLVGFQATASASVSTITMSCTSSSTLTANECFVGIYDTGQTSSDNATKLAASATGVAETYFDLTGLVHIPLSASVSLTAGQGYYVAILYNGSAFSMEALTTVNSTFRKPLSPNPPPFCESTGGKTSLTTPIDISSTSIPTFLPLAIVY